MKTPSFSELRTLVEYLEEELLGAQLQEVSACEDGIVLAFYRFHMEPRNVFLVFDLDKAFPFLGYFPENPWKLRKKTKPVGLFLNAHARNHQLTEISLVEKYGRVVRLKLGQGETACDLEFRMIPRQANLTVQVGKKSISWFPLKELTPGEPVSPGSEDEIRGITFMMGLWLQRRGVGAAAGKGADTTGSPFEKWKKNREKDLTKKEKALAGVAAQIEKFQNEEWSAVGEFLKQNGLKNLPPEWSVYVDFEKSASANMQACFEKAKAAKIKIKGAVERLELLKKEIEELRDLNEKKFEEFLRTQAAKKNKPAERKVEGRLRKAQLSDDLVAYMGKSAADNMALLRKSKPFDLWLHLRDYPSAHAILHLQKDRKVPDADLKKAASWLVHEGLTARQVQMGGTFAVVVVECRHVKALKGDKLGRVTYHNAREFLIAI